MGRLDLSRAWLGMSLLKDNLTCLSDLGRTAGLFPSAALPRDKADAGRVEGLGLKKETKQVPGGLRVLLVEDEPLIAIDSDDILRAAGVADVVWVRTVAEGMNALGSNTFHAALLDLRLGQESSVPLAQRLAVMDIPFGFLTGFQDNAIPQEFRDRPMVAKPFTAAQLWALLSGLVGPA